MTIVRTSVFSVLKRFPDCRDRIMTLFRESDPFRTLCEDYEMCLLSLRHWNASEAAEAAVRREEYASILEDLESEIGQQLDAAG